MESVAYLGETLTRWRVGTSTFLALPERGARLMNWHVTLGDGTVRDVLYWPELTSTTEFHRVRGGNPILFPFSGRTFHRGEIYTWRAPDGAVRPMPMHGLARQGTFRIARIHDRGFTAVLQPSPEAEAAYPYRYEFAVSYRFAPLSLSCEFLLTNHDEKPLPWSAGHHFYFTVPWAEGLRREDYAIRIPAARRLRQNAGGELIPGPALATEESLSHPDLIDTLHLGLRSNEVVFGPRGIPGQVRIRMGTSKTPAADAALVTWTTDAAAPYYCVEPWMGPPNAAEHQVGLHWVRPGQSQSFVVELDVA